MNYPQRRYARAKWHAYDGATYFITVCTHNFRHYFGETVGQSVSLSPIGKALDENLASIGSHHDNVDIPLWVVMPNHFHALVIVNDCEPVLKGCLSIGETDESRRFTLPGDKRALLSVAVGGVKAAITRYARRNGLSFGWQPRFHDRIVRNWGELDRISDYIRNNPARWAEDRFNCGE